MRLLGIGLLLAFAAVQAADIQTIQPAELVQQLRGKGPQPAIIHVGFSVLQMSKRIPHTIYAGPGNSPAGLDLLRKAVDKLPRNADIVIYCGCCPWDHCHNIKPAMQVLKQMGFTRARALYIPTNMPTDGYEKGYPTETGPPANK